MSVTLYDVQFEGGPRDGHRITVTTAVSLPLVVRFPAGPPGGPRRYTYELKTDAQGAMSYRYRGVEVLG